MKTKKLIKLLQEADPSGEQEVCVGNIDIFHIDALPAYYDGCMQILKRDENLKCYNIVGALYTSEGSCSPLLWG